MTIEETALAISGPGAEPTLLATDGRATEATETSPLAPGERLARYVVVDMLGAGGMGVVYTAYDPELDRRVAIKLIRPELSGSTSGTGSDARTRLLREAQALARLSHPNVVAVHDVGAVGERVWLAMEFVEGQTLADWCGRQRRGVRELLEVMTQAGRGLAAAHQAGLVHRDFKPDNVMVGSDGRVRVMDLGLARRERADPSDLMTTSAGSAGSSVLAIAVTQIGAVLGTPAYMAPEQFRGAEVGPLADVFAYCVTFWEALYGERPFAGDTLGKLAAEVCAGKRGPPPRGRRVPRWLRDALIRGLAPLPARRWPDMPALLAALARGQARAHLRKAGAALTAVALLAGGGWAWQQAALDRTISACADEGAVIDAAWNDAARSRVRAAVVASGVTYAASTADKLMPWLDRQAAAWRTAQTEACLDTRVRAVWSEDLFARASWCLDERRMELDSLVAELSRVDAKVVARAVGAAVGLASVEPCRDPHALARLPMPPPEVRQATVEVRAILAQVRNLWAAGRYTDGLTLARGALKQAEALAWPPLIAAAQAWVARLLDSDGRYAEAETQAADAYFAAFDAGALEIHETDLAMQLANVVGFRLARPTEGRWWVRHAEALSRSLTAGEGLLAARVLAARGLVEFSAGAFSESRALYEQALALEQRILGSDHPTVADRLDDLAQVLTTMGAYAEAQALHERALPIREHILGPDHPDIAVSLTSLAGVHAELRHVEEARALYERSLALQRRALGPDHPHVAGTLNNFATLLQSTGADAEALTALEEALGIVERALGSDHPTVAAILGNVANARFGLGATAEALPLYLRALRIQEKALGPDHAELGATLNNLGTLQQQRGEMAAARASLTRALGIYERAYGPDHRDVAMVLGNLGSLTDGAEGRRYLERAVAIFERSLGPDHPELILPLENLALDALKERRPADAVPFAARALALSERAEGSPEQRAALRYLLARALWAAPADQGRERVRARQLAEQAVGELEGSPDAALRTEISTWLARHRVAR